MVSSLAQPEIIAIDAAMDQLASLRPKWDGGAALVMDRRILSCARSWFRNLDAESRQSLPAVVPLASGAIQFEWHCDSRILELELETHLTIHFLKWDPASKLEIEGTYPANDFARSEELIAWVRHG